MQWATPPLECHQVTSSLYPPHPRTELPQGDGQGRTGLEEPLTIFRMAALECSAAVAISSKDSMAQRSIVRGEAAGKELWGTWLLHEYLLWPDYTLPSPANASLKRHITQPHHFKSETVQTNITIAEIWNSWLPIKCKFGKIIMTINWQETWLCLDSCFWLLGLWIVLVCFICLFLRQNLAIFPWVISKQNKTTTAAAARATKG